jgi:hypothetical protein
VIVSPKKAANSAANTAKKPRNHTSWKLAADVNIRLVAEAIRIAALLFLLACVRCLAHSDSPHRAFDNDEPALLA